jgi:hypothetical protein
MFHTRLVHCERSVAEGRKAFLTLRHGAPAPDATEGGGDEPDLRVLVGTVTVRSRPYVRPPPPTRF